MTEHPTPASTPTSADKASAAARQARVAALSRGRSTKRRHPAQGARIAAAGIGATTMLGLLGVMGYAARPATAPASTPAPVTQPQVVVVVHRTGAPDKVTSPGTPDAAVPTVVATADASAATTLTARPTIRPASPQAQAPAASTSGSG